MQRIENHTASGYSRIKHMKHPLNVTAMIGLALGGVFGMAGTFVAESNLRSIFWGIDGLALVVATTILALKYFPEVTRLRPGACGDAAACKASAQSWSETGGPGG
jgi:hypothetical protein